MFGSLHQCLGTSAVAGVEVASQRESQSTSAVLMGPFNQAWQGARHTISLSKELRREAT